MIESRPTVVVDSSQEDTYLGFVAEACRVVEVVEVCCTSKDCISVPSCRMTLARTQTSAPNHKFLFL